MSSHATSLAFSMILLIAGSRAGAVDDYLQALEAEAQRLAPLEQSAHSPDKGDRERFEAELKKHKGTYSIYSKLQEKDRAEVFKSWQEGATFPELRRMIINRSLHR